MAQGPNAMTEMLLEYDESSDAAYLMVSDAPWDHQVRLDDARGIKAKHGPLDLSRVTHYK